MNFRARSSTENACVDTGLPVPTPKSGGHYSPYGSFLSLKTG